MTANGIAPGKVVALWRYPVKSMMGQELNAAAITAGGVSGDRAWALVDRAEGKVATAKNPRKWPRLFEFRAVPGDAPGDVRITFPDGEVVDSRGPGRDELLSRALGRAVTLEAVAQVQRAATAEEYWPDMEGLEHRDTVTGFGLPEGAFFDAAPLHLLTTATLDTLRAAYPQGRFEAPRFRPNIVVEAASGGFVENAWIGHDLAIGSEVLVRVTAPCLRCVMTTLAQGDLPADSGILRAAVRHNGARVGVYASVLQAGTVRRGDGVRLA